MFSLTGAEISHFLLAMATVLALAHLLGYLAERLFIPRVIGEVAAGLTLGPTLLGYYYPDTFQWLFLGFETEGKLFGLVYQIGLLLLMFSAGLKFQTKFEKGDAKITSALVIGSTFPAFIIGWLSTSMFNITPYLGTANNTTPSKSLSLFPSTSHPFPSYPKLCLTSESFTPGLPNSSFPLPASTIFSCGRPSVSPHRSLRKGKEARFPSDRCPKV